MTRLGRNSGGGVFMLGATAMTAATRLTVAVLLCLLASSAAAQGRPPAPQPGPEHQRLGYFVGNWRTEGEVKPGPFSTGGRFISTDRVEWLDGRFFVVERATSTLPTGNQIQLSVIGWDARQKVYTFNSFNSAGIRTWASGAPRIR